MNFAARLRANVVLLTFLGMYGLTTVAGNFVYVTQYGSRLAGASIADFDITKFQTTDIGYWVLLLMPFALVPPVALLVRNLLRPHIERVVSMIPPIHPAIYIVLCGVFYGYVALSFYRAGVIASASKGLTAAASSEARFELLAALGYWPQAVLKSILVFLAIYSVLRAILSSERFWIIVAAMNVALMTALLILLNMKWPAVLFYFAILLCIVVTQTGLRFLLAATAAVLVIYVTTTFLVTRFSTAQGKTVLNTFGTFVSAAVNRMALPYPYYYQTFTYDGPVCGTIVDRLDRKISPCHPSNLIYEKVFGKDGFEGRATAPAAAHITGYALGGWAGATVALVLCALVIGVFEAVAIVGAMSAAIVVMGSLAAYYLSQLPFEAVVFYDHGLLWWFLLLAVYATSAGAFRWLR